LGIFLLLSVVFIWVTSSFITNHILVDQSFASPFFLTYLNTGSFSLYLVFFLIGRTIKRLRREEREDNIVLLSPSSGTTSPSEKLTFLDTFRLGLAFCVLWFAANWSTNAALRYTSVASSTILSSTSGFFTLIIGALTGTEAFDFTKLIAAGVTITGVILVSVSETSGATGFASSSDTMLGDVLALTGAFFYGCYSVFLKRAIGDENRINMALFFGCVGVWNLCLLWPMFWVLDVTRIEPFVWPNGKEVWMSLLVNALVGTCLSDYLWLRAVLLTSPLVVTLGLTMTIPLALAGDITLKGASPGFEYWLGAMLVLSGFMAANASEIFSGNNEDEQSDGKPNEEVLPLVRGVGVVNVTPLTDEENTFAPKATIDSRVRERRCYVSADDYVQGE